MQQATVKLFCPKCEDIYFPRSKYQVCWHMHHSARRAMRYPMLRLQAPAFGVQSCLFASGPIVLNERRTMLF